MKSFERFSRFFGIIKVRQNANQVRITGLDGLIMRKYFKDLFETDAISKQMFTSVTDTAITFNQFFVPDFLYMLSVFKQSKKCGWSARRTIDRIVHGIETNTWWKVTTQPVTSMIDDKKLGLLKWNPMPKQMEFLHLYGHNIPKYDLRGYLLAAAPGTGKCAPLDSLVLTDIGWVKMGDVTLETKVVTPDGGVADIVGIYPQGIKDVYRVTLSDGRRAECSDDHLWKVYFGSPNNLPQITCLRNMRASSAIMFLPVYNPDNKTTKLVQISSITRISRKETQCIAVDHPDHLYITDDYIVTHNTFMDLMVATCVIPKEIAEVKIVISPKKAIHLVWEKSIGAVFKNPPTCWVSDSGAKMPLEGIEYYVFNFEKLDMAIELGQHLKSKGIRYFVIVDESHNFADHRSNRTQKLVKLQTVRDDIYFIWASGSPILKLASELVSFLKCSDPRFDDDAERRFKRIYSSSPGRANQIFNHRLGKMIAFLVAKTEVSETKPTIKELPVKLPPSLAHKYLMSTVREEMKQFITDRLVFYKDNIKECRILVDKWMNYHETTLKTRTEHQAFVNYQKNLKMIMQAPDLMLAKVTGEARAYELTKLFPSLPPMERKAFRNALSAVKNIKLKVRGEALGTVLAKRRSECAATLGIYCKPDEIMKESLSKTLFFASSVLPVKVLEKYLTEKGFEPLAVYAETNANLTANIEAFTNDPNINPICATMQSLSEAVPVIAASTVVLLNRPFRQAVFDQVIARADRLGQIHPVTVIEVTLDTGDEPNVSSTTDAILTGVRELINSLMGPAFAGPDPDERVYQALIDASTEDPVLVHDYAKAGL